MSENVAALVPGPAMALTLTPVPAKHPAAGEILIRNYCIAIQPLDAKMLISGYAGAGGMKTYPSLLGTSAAGVVEEVGEGVDEFKIGDRVVADTGAYVKGGDANLREGTWQRFVICAVETVAKIGESQFEQAVLLEFPLQTAVVALQLFLGMGKPNTGNADEKVLVWGAGGAVGTYAVQYARSVGHTIIVTASPRDTERQKSIGASEVLDYKAPDTLERLRALGPYKYLITASGDPASQKALASLLQPKGGSYASVLGGDFELPANVKRAYAAFSQAAQSDENAEFRTWWYREYVPQVLNEGSIQPVGFTKRGGGLAALQEASKDVVDGKVRGKIVINPQEG